MSSGASPATSSEHGLLTVVERVSEIWRTWPRTCLWILLATALLTSLADRSLSVGQHTTLLILSAALAGWISAWVRVRRISRPAWVRIAVAALGTSLAGASLAQHFAYLAVALPLAVDFSVSLSLGWAIVMILGISFSLHFTIGRLAATTQDMSNLVAVDILRTLGMLTVFAVVRTVATQSEERRRLLETLAESERRAGQLEERQRVAREIHDTLAQGFAGIVVHLEAADLAAPHSVDVLRANLRYALGLARENLEEARRLMAALRPELLDRHELVPALRRVCADWSQRSGVPSSVTITGTLIPLGPDAEIALLRAVQEALTNVRRHATAKSVAVTISYMDSLVALDVRDDGRGFEPRDDAVGFGLRSMRERVEQLGGSLTIESGSQEGGGTTIAVTLPVPGQMASFSANSAVLSPTGLAPVPEDR